MCVSIELSISVFLNWSCWGIPYNSCEYFSSLVHVQLFAFSVFNNKLLSTLSAMLHCIYVCYLFHGDHHFNGQIKFILNIIWLFVSIVLCMLYVHIGDLKKGWFIIVKTFYKLNCYYVIYDGYFYRTLIID